LDGTQTTDPTEAGPGYVPGHASAYRRALDDQAMTDGPLDLTVPLNIAEVRAALATTGPLRRVGLAAYVAASKSTSAGSARPQDGQGGGHRRAGTRYPTGKPKRIGRIFAFVAVATALSIGTAYALVLSNSAQNTSVSLPATGAIPVAPSAKNSQSGQVAADSGSTSAQAAPSLSRSTGHQLPVPPPTAKHAAPTSSATASTEPSATASAGSSASAGGPTNTPPAGSDPTSTGGSGTQWNVLYEGQNTSSQTTQETASVQNLLQDLGYLQTWRHRTYIDPGYAVSADPNGYYGSATTQAITEFQQDYGVNYSDQLGETDANTYQALVQVVQEAESE
jgi:Putative peptidoglycan binding domain